MQPIVQNDGGKQNHAPDDVLHFAVHVHDGEGIEQGTDQGAADHYAEHAAAAADQADASEHDHEDDVEDIGALHHRHLNTAGGADPDQPGDPGQEGHDHIFEDDQRAECNSAQPGGLRIVALGVDEAAGRGARQEEMDNQRAKRKDEDRHRHAEEMPGAEKEQRLRIGRRIDDPDRREPEGASVNYRTGSQRDEQRRSLDERHHNAVYGADT